MAKALLIKNERGIKKVGDPVCIVKDSHIFDQNELDRFTEVYIPGTDEEVTALSLAHRPERKFVIPIGGKFYEEGSQEALLATEKEKEGIKTLWRNGEQWNELKQRPYKWGTWDGDKFVGTVTRHFENITTVIAVEAKSLESE